MTHTPGPWRIGGAYRTAKDLQWCTIAAGAGTPIARLLPIHAPGAREAGDFDTEATNARLIAKAPEMRDILATLLKETNQHVETNAICLTSECSKLLEVCNNARAILREIEEGGHDTHTGTPA